MAISIETLALAKKYADAVAAAGSQEALDRAIQEAVSQSKVYTDEVVSHFVNFSVEIVEQLPSTGDSHTIYFVQRDTPSGEADFYFEYIYINSSWELIGSTQLSLDDYWTIDEVKEYVISKVYTLPVATKTSLGGVKIDGDSISIDAEGVLHVVDTYVNTLAKDAAEETVGDNVIQITDKQISNLFI